VYGDQGNDHKEAAPHEEDAKEDGEEAASFVSLGKRKGRRHD
jgi:hypothetical protein